MKINLIIQSDRVRIEIEIMGLFPLIRIFKSIFVLNWFDHGALLRKVIILTNAKYRKVVLTARRGGNFFLAIDIKFEDVSVHSSCYF